MPRVTTAYWLSELYECSIVLLDKEDAVARHTTLVLSKGYTLPVGVAKVRGRRVVGMEEKPRLDISVTVGCMVLGPRAVKLALRHGWMTKADLMLDFVPRLLKNEFKVAAYYIGGPWYDIGTLASYEKLSSELEDDTLRFL